MGVETTSFLKGASSLGRLWYLGVRGERETGVSTGSPSTAASRHFYSGSQKGIWMILLPLSVVPHIVGRHAAAGGGLCLPGDIDQAEEGCDPGQVGMA